MTKTGKPPIISPMSMKLKGNNSGPATEGRNNFSEVGQVVETTKESQEKIPVAAPITIGGVGPESLFLPVTSSEIADTELPERIWLWDAWIPTAAFVALSAHPKAGKTTFMTRLILHLVRGVPFLGYAVKATPTLLLAVEESKYDVYRRLKSLGLKREDELYVHTGHLFMAEHELKKIEEFCLKQGIGCIVVDTLSHFWNIEDENDNAKVAREMRKLLRLRDKTGATVIIIHHERKNGQQGEINGTNMRGAGAIFSSVDQAITLHRVGGQKNRRCLTSMGRYQETPEELIIELKEGLYTALGCSQDANDLDAFKRVAMVINGVPKDINQIALATGLADRYCRKLLDKYGHMYMVIGSGKKGDPFRWALKSE